MQAVLAANPAAIEDVALECVPKIDKVRFNARLFTIVLVGCASRRLDIDRYSFCLPDGLTLLPDDILASVPANYQTFHLVAGCRIEGDDEIKLVANPVTGKQCYKLFCPFPRPPILIPAELVSEIQYVRTTAKPK